MHSIIIHMPEKEGFRFWLRGGNPQPFEHSMQNNGSTSAVQESLEDTVRVPKAGILKYKDQVHNVSQGMFLIGQFIVSKYPYLFFPLLGAEEEQPSSVQETPEPTAEIAEDDILEYKDLVHNVGQGMFLIGQFVFSKYPYQFLPLLGAEEEQPSSVQETPEATGESGDTCSKEEDLDAAAEAAYAVLRKEAAEAEGKEGMKGET